MQEHSWAYCDMCDHDVVICGKCGMNTCSGGYGTVGGELCIYCPSAYELYFKGKPDETISLELQDLS